MTDNHPSSKPDVSKANTCPPLPKDATGLDKLVYWLGIGLGSGLPKRAPGTWGTLGGLLVALPLMMLGFTPFLIVTIVASLIGIWICDRTSKLMNVHDDPHIVWDEWVGIWITLLPIEYVGKMVVGTNNLLAFNILFFLVAFILFRFFDILKPFPISWADKKVAGGFGIMLDDILAGLMSIIVIIIMALLASYAVLSLDFVPN